jgi:hypothetical protein
MLISTGKVAPSEPWRILEVAINQAPDVLALRITKALRGFHGPVEALVPFTPNACGQAEWIVEHVYARGLNGSLGKLARTPGIDFVRPETAPQTWIACLLEAEATNRPGPKVGDFVRLLTGPCARLCGTVTKREDEGVTVEISMSTKKVRVHTNRQNAQLVECPPDKQSFFFA